VHTQKLCELMEPPKKTSRVACDGSDTVFCLDVCGSPFVVLFSFSSFFGVILPTAMLSSLRMVR
jgi:hypothetical protein